MPSNILIVDDSDVQREHVAALCRELVPAAEIRQCADGAEAIASLRQRAADVVITDLEMPVMDGVLLAGYVADENLAQAIIICSSKDPQLIASVGTMSEFRGLQVLGTLQKPIWIDSLRYSLGKFRAGASTQTGAPRREEQTPQIIRDELIAAMDEGVIEPYYQPKLTTNGLLLKGVETLIRWRHSEYGFIPPPIFVSLAEQTGLINELTLYLLRRGAEHIRLCEGRGLRLTWSFNLSPQSVADGAFAQRLGETLNEAGVKPGSVIFEVTENMLLENRASALQALARLRLSGYGLSIDDFGSGFANAEQLAMLPATELKIDRSLVDGAARKPRQRQILESTVRLAQNLNLVTVAEGIENFDDYRLLKALGVDLVQGFYFARPMPIDKLFEWINSDLSALRKQTKAQLAPDADA